MPVTALAELLDSVDAVFDATGHGCAPWPSLRSFHDDIPDEAYSRVTEPERYRIVGARADAWVTVLIDAALARVDEVEAVDWIGDRPAAASIGRHRRLVPLRAGSIPLVFVTTGFAGPVDNGLEIGAGDPAVRVGIHPDCGCDACDFGSDDLLEQIDDSVLDVVSGLFTYRWKGDRRLRLGRSSTSYNFDVRRRWRRRIAPVDRDDWRRELLDATDGWDEISGTSWLG